MKRILACFLTLIFYFSAGCAYIVIPSGEIIGDGLYVYFADVGQADAALILCDGHAMLIDGGNTGDGAFLVSFLREKGVSELDYVIATHAHEDHIGGLESVLRTFPCKTVYAPVTEASSAVFKRFKEASARSGGITLCLRGTSGQVGGASFDVLWPVEPEKETDVNNTSIVLRLTFGRAAFLFTGDLEYDAESRLLLYDDDLSSTVLKVGHHGSSSSTSYYFLRRALPQYAVISCGQNNDYGHPHRETIEILDQAQADVLRTDKDGTIEMKTDGDLLTVIANGRTVTKAITLSTPALDAQNLELIGNKKTKVFHLPFCKSLPKEENRVKFSTRAEAVDAGFSPCSSCRP